MNPTSPWRAPLTILFRFAMKCRRFLPIERSRAFGPLSTKERPHIDLIYVINLARQSDRWAAMERELRHVLNGAGVELWSLTERYAAVDASQFTQDPLKDIDVDPLYTLGDQLFVEPQPLALPSRLKLDSPIRMSRPEIAIARSHINIWRKVAEGKHDYVLVLEDDVWIRPGFASRLDLAWREIGANVDVRSNFDILYLSYAEVKHGAPKSFVSSNVFRPVRGLWHLSGYVVSKEGAEKLLALLPCRGPVDLWLNQQFERLNVLATRHSIVCQRPDLASTNSYSILPALTNIGAITSERASLFHARPTERPVFAFGPRFSGLSSLAMALSMLGYRCCSDLETIPSIEHDLLLSGKKGRVFDAYVNINALEKSIEAIRRQYPHAKFIVTTDNARTSGRMDSTFLDELVGADVAFLDLAEVNKWQVICEHLRCAPPAFFFPDLPDRGQRRLIVRTTDESAAVPKCKTPKRDASPWIIEPREWWQGIHCHSEKEKVIQVPSLRISDSLESLDMGQWLSRDDTFADNLALFRPANVECLSGFGAALKIRKEPLGVREYSAASLTSRNKYLFGRFEATIKASNVPGVVTGVFLYRDSPRQEIDIEITGNRTNRLLVNVFYNPGGRGAKFDYGYRGAASYIDLGFDASQAYHRFAIEWEEFELRWFVDDRLVHRRVDWQPTPIPHLPMALHVNAWPSRSKELAGRLSSRRLPTATFVKSIVLETQSAEPDEPNAEIEFPIQRHVPMC